MNARYLAMLLLFAGVVALAGCNREESAPEKPSQVSEERIKELVGLLASKDVQQARNARDELTAIGAPAVPHLLKATTETDSYLLRGRYAETIAAMGETAVPALVKAMTGDDEDLQYYALRVAAEMGPKAKAALPALTKIFDTADDGGMVDAYDVIRTIRDIGITEKELPWLFGLVNEDTDWSDDPDDIVGIAMALSPQIGLKAMEHKNPHVRRVFCPSLKSLIPDEPLAMKALLKAAAYDKNEEVRHAAVCVLAGIEPATDEIIEALRLRLSDWDEIVQWEAVAALGKIGSRAATTIDDIVRSIRYSKYNNNAMDALRNMGETVIPTVAAMLSEDSSKTQCSAAFVLGKFGDEAKGTVDELAKVISKGDTNASLAAMEAIRRIHHGTENVLAALTKTLDAKEPQLRIVAGKTLGGLDMAYPAAIPPLLSRLKDDNPPLRVAAAEGLAGTARDSEEAAVALSACISDPIINVSSAAAYALSRTNVRSEQVISTLADALDSETYFVRRNAALVLGETENLPAPAIEKLASLLEDNERQVRETACIALGNIGTPALMVLQKTLKNDNPNIRLYALWAMNIMGVKAQPAAEDISAVLSDENREIRLMAVIAVQNITIDGEKNRQLLLGLVKNDKTQLRSEAIVALGCCRPVKPDTVSQLIKFAESSDKILRSTGYLALSKTGTDCEQSMAFLRKKLICHEKWTRRRALNAMENAGWQPANDYDKACVLLATGELMELVVMKAATRELVIIAIREIEKKNANGNNSFSRPPFVRPRKLEDTYGDFTENIVPALASLLDDKDRGVRLFALRELGSILQIDMKYIRQDKKHKHEELRKETQKILAGVMKSEDQEMVNGATNALCKIYGNANEKTIAVLVEFLKSGNINRRLMTIIVLGEAGWESKAAEAALTETAENDKDARIRQAAAVAIEYMKERREKAANGEGSSSGDGGGLFDDGDDDGGGSFFGDNEDYFSDDSYEWFDSEEK